MTRYSETTTNQVKENEYIHLRKRVRIKFAEIIYHYLIKTFCGPRLRHECGREDVEEWNLASQEFLALTWQVAKLTRLPILTWEWPTNKDCSFILFLFFEISLTCNYINFRYITWWFDIYIYCKRNTPVKLVNIHHHIVTKTAHFLKQK